MARPSEHEELTKLRESVVQPSPVALGQADHRSGHRDELVGLQIHERRGLGLADARRREEERSRDAEHRGEASEDGGPRLLNATRLELRDRGTRDADAARELSLSEVQSLARGSDRQREGWP